MAPKIGGSGAEVAPSRVHGIVLAPRMAAQKKKQDQGDRLVSKNRRATFDYTLGETIEAGLVLIGSEVRALREGPANLVEAWVELDRRAQQQGIAFELAQSEAPREQAQRRRRFAALGVAPRFLELGGRGRMLGARHSSLLQA